MFKKKMFYESMPFAHFKIVKDLSLQYKYAKIHSQPNHIFIESNEEIQLPYLINIRMEEWSKIGMFYDECYSTIQHLIEPYSVMNKDILHKLACLNTNPKLITFDYTEIQCNFDLIQPLILSVMTDQLIFFTTDYKCLLICDHSCSLSMQNLYNVLRGRLFDRFFALKSDLEHDLENHIDWDLIHICSQIKPQNLSTEIIDFLCKYCYYDQYSKTVNEDISLMGTVSAIKFNNPQLRQIHTKENSSMEVEFMRVAIALSKFTKYDLPKGNLDPFGLKRAADCIVEYTSKYGLQLPEFPDEVLQFLNKRLKHSLITSYMKYAKHINWLTIHEDKNVYFNIDEFLRLNNLYSKNKDKSTQNISLTQQEKQLSESIKNMTYIQTSNILDELIVYINNNRIADYKERMEIIGNFIGFLLNIFHISDLQKIRLRTTL
jgi:hypothetical protein